MRGVIIILVLVGFLVLIGGLSQNLKEHKAEILCELEGGLHHYDWWYGIGYCNNEQRVSP